MATKAQLEAEIWWRNEYVPPGLQSLAISLRIHFNVGPEFIGSKGDYNHLRGYHRSFAWIKNSNYCTNRTYSVSRTPGDRNPGDVNWVTGMDIGGMSQSELMAMCRRLDAAVRAGRLEKITEWYGNINGDTRVDGFDNISNVLATSDSSHLSHLHLSFDRGRANENHDDVLAILTGEDVTPEEIQSNVIVAIHTMLDKMANRSDATGRQAADDFNKMILNAGAVDQPTTGGGLTEEQVRALIREELDKTRFTGA